MSRRAVFTKAEVSRAVRAVKDAGEPVERVEIEPGKITVFAGKPNQPRANANEWDGELR